MTELIKIIGRYKPKNKPNGCYLRNKVTNLGYIYKNYHFRNPKNNRYVYFMSNIDDVKLWHTDPEIESRPKFHALWATKTATEMFMPDGAIYKCKCYDIVIYNNRLCKHRMPKYLSKTRYFARFWDIKKGNK